MQKNKLSNAFKALQNESLNVLNQFLETIYEYKSYFCIFSFFTFCSYFPGIPRRSHCVSPLCLPVVFPRFWVEVLFHVFALIHDEFLGFSMCFCRFLILSMIYIYIYIYLKKINKLYYKHKQNKVQ